MTLGSGLGCLVRPQLRCWPGLQSPLLLEDSLLRGLSHLTGKLRCLLVGGLSSFAHGPLHRAAWMAWALTSSRACNPVEQEGNCSAFYNLASEFTHCHLHHSLSGAQNSPDPLWEGATWGHKYQQVRVIGCHLGGGLCYVVIHFRSLNNSDLSLKTLLTDTQLVPLISELPLLLALALGHLSLPSCTKLHCSWWFTCFSLP